MDLSIIVPMFNECENVEPLVEEIVAALYGHVDFEIICVDDGSEDGTEESIGRARERFPDLVRSVRHESNCGQSASLWTGARAARAPWIVTIDGDGQNDPADIRRLLEIRQSQPRSDVKLVAGLRARRQDRWIRRVSSRIANAVRSRVLRDGVRDTGCALKLIEREFFLALPFFDHMHRFIPALIRGAGGEIVTVDVGHRPRVRGQSKYGVNNRLWAGLVDMLGVLWLIRRMKSPRIAENTTDECTTEPTARGRSTVDRAETVRKREFISP